MCYFHVLYTCVLLIVYCFLYLLHLWRSINSINNNVVFFLFLVVYSHFKTVQLWYIEFGNIHRIGRRGTNNARPIVARFMYHNDLQMVLQNAYKLKGSSSGISEQYPAEINNRRKNLYPIMREAKQQRRHVVLVRDRLFIDGEQYIPPEDRPVNVDNVWNSPPHLQHGQGHNSHITPGRLKNATPTGIVTKPRWFYRPWTLSQSFSELCCKRLKRL